MFDFLFGKTEKLDLIKLYGEAISFASELGLESKVGTKSQTLYFYVPNINRSDEDGYFMSIYMHTILGEIVPYGLNLPKNYGFYNSSGNLYFQHFTFGEAMLPTGISCTRPAWEKMKKRITNMHDNLLHEFSEQQQVLKQLQIFKSTMNFKA